MNFHLDRRLGALRVKPPDNVARNVKLYGNQFEKNTTLDDTIEFVLFTGGLVET